MAHRLQPFIRMNRLLPLALVLATVACGASATSEGTADVAPITSNEDAIIDFTFDGELVTSPDTETKKAITDQLFYTVGQLTTQFNANGQVGRAVLGSVAESREGAMKKITYKARMPVAWPKGRAVPTKQDIVLPRDTTKFDAFNAKYDGKCGTNEYGQEYFWHDWNPKAAGCRFDAADVVSRTAAVTKNKDETDGSKYPEYAEVWKDGSFDVVAIFGYSDGGAAGDEGGRQYDDFVTRVKSSLTNATQTVNAPGSDIKKDITIKGTTKIGGEDKPVTITCLQVDALYQTGSEFDGRYDPLSEKADMVIYNGHSELSKNTNDLARRGKVTKNKYQIFFFDSCDTYAYLDTKLTDRRIETNGADVDPKGSKYLDVATNVLPSYFSNYASSSLSLFDALLKKDAPKTYNQILAELPADQVVVVSGEEDNSFRP